jgi:two-component system sensor histidine kinase KdpD
MAYVLGRMTEEQRRLARRDRENAERLQDLDRLKSEFVATVSHELRTPLTAVVGFASTLRSRWSELSPQVRQEFLDRLADNARSLEHLITHLLDFGRLERGEFRLEPQDHDLRELVDRIHRNMVHELEGHEVVADVPPGLVVRADAYAFERILGNLLSNAAKFSPPGTRIEVTGRPHGSGVVLAVRDHGAGIPDEALPHVFERFYRGAHTTRGTGIGLAVVKDLVELHGGTVEAANAPSGAVVTVRLPNVLPAARTSARAGDSTLPT